jgi:hypothetical protein
LNHPLIPFKISRLVRALYFMVEATGDAGARALRTIAAFQDEKDEYPSTQEMTDGPVENGPAAASAEHREAPD